MWKIKISWTLTSFLLLAVIGSVLSAPAPLVAANVCQLPQALVFPFAVQAGASGVQLLANARVNGEVRSNGDIAGQLFARIEGDAQAAGSISGVIVTGQQTAHASSTALPAINLTDWQTAAAGGGVISGDVVFGVNSQGNVFGPAQINGNVVLLENSEVILSGNLFVTGSITIGKNAKFRLAHAFGNLGTVVIAQGKIEIDGNAVVEGNGGGSFLLIVSAAPNGSDAIKVKANFLSQTTIFYALSAGLMVDANVQIIAGYGQGVSLGRNSVVNFVSGLQFAAFICPPPPQTQPQIAVSKTPSVVTVVPQAVFDYTVRVSNSGTATATAVRVADLLPAELELVSALPLASATSTQASRLLLEWNLGDIGPGESRNLNVGVKVKPGTLPGTQITNRAQVGGSNFSSVSADASPVMVLAVTQEADLSLSKQADKTAAFEGQTVVYTLQVINRGPATSTAVTVTEPLSPFLQFISATTTLGSVLDATTTLWSVGQLAPSSTASLLLTAKIKPGSAGQTIVNTAAVASAQPDDEASNNTASASLIVLPEGSMLADLAITKAINSVEPKEGGGVTYLISVTNRGPATSTAVTVTEPLSPFLQFISATTTLGSVLDATTTLWSVGQLAPSSTASLLLTAKIKPGSAGQTIVNTATVLAAAGDLNPGNNQASVNFLVNATAVGVGGGSGGSGGGSPVAIQPPPATTAPPPGLPQSSPGPPLAGLPGETVAGAEVAETIPETAKTGEILGQTQTSPAGAPAAPVTKPPCQPLAWWWIGYAVYAALPPLVYWLARKRGLGQAAGQSGKSPVFKIYTPPVILLAAGLLWWWLEPCSRRFWAWPAAMGIWLIIWTFVYFRQDQDKDNQQPLPLGRDDS